MGGLRPPFSTLRTEWSGCLRGYYFFFAAFLRRGAAFLAAFLGAAFLAARFFAGAAFFAAFFFAGAAFLAAFFFLAGAFFAAFLGAAFLAAFFFLAGAFFAAFLGAAFFAAFFFAGAAFLRAFFAAATVFPLCLRMYYFLGFNVALSVELAENFIAVEAGTVTVAPVCGLRPVRSLRLVVLNEPKPGHATLSPLFVVSTTSSKNAAIVRSASALETSAF